ncbi:DUF4166 domain-containing protein [Jannaschia formosa]|uniref:DUF4166 domain-containing protein n=1 Tax=Jannaschia formosa TaxID=2259592 RepID=UPI002474E083|nr:DUF4166 domain-containing protein [Jannaschia formosa]
MSLVRPHRSLPDAHAGASRPLPRPARRGITPLYRRALGAAFDALPPALRRLHGGPGRWRGMAELTQGTGAARLAARSAGYPGAEGTLPLTLTIAQDGPGEIWTRSFDGFPVVSHQRLRPDGRIAERLGPATVLLQAEARADALSVTVAGLRAGPLPLPSVLTGGGVETAEAEAVRFDVSARLPGIGLLIRYRGTLHPD